MHIELWLIRHGMTPGNALGKYVGWTDEPLSMGGRQILEARQKTGIYPPVDQVYVSPMKRCRETAGIIFPDIEQYVINGIQECHFGDFEYKNYQELKGEPVYQAWIDSGGTSGFPGGETLTGFQNRVVKGFNEMAELLIAKYNNILQPQYVSSHPTEIEALVAHGGTIMAILDKYSRPHKSYFEWQAKNGCGYVVTMDTDRWAEGDCFLTVQSVIEDSEV